MKLRSTTTSASASPWATSPRPISSFRETLLAISGFASNPAVNMSSCKTGAPGFIDSTSSIT